MAVLSSAVIAAGVRAGQFVRYYETVAQLLATTDSLSVGEIIRTPKYEYECVSTGEHLTTAGGAKLKCLASPYVTPDQFGAPGQGNDETAYVEAAIASKLPVFLNRYYDVDNVQFPNGIDGVTIVGAGPNMSGLKGRNTESEAILQTFESGQTSYTGGIHLTNFGIIGYGKRGLAAVQLINSTIEHVHFVSGGDNGQSPNAFWGEDTVVLETCFGNVFSDIQCGAGSSRSDFRVNACVLDTIVNMLYTNNASIPHHIEIDQSRYEIATLQSPGHGLITFNTPTLQGARGYAIKITSSFSVKFHNIYLENVVGAILSLDCDHLYVDGSEIGSNSDAHCIWLDQSRGSISYAADFVGCQIDEPVVVGSGTIAVNFVGGKGCDIADVLFVDNTYKVSGPTAVGGSNGVALSHTSSYEGSGGSSIGIRCSNGGKHAKLTVAEDGTVSGGTPFSNAYVDHFPHSPVVTMTGSSSPAWTNGVAITPITPVYGGGTAPYTFALGGDKVDVGDLPTGVTVNASTGQVSGTPTETGTFRFRVLMTDANGMTDLSRLIVATVS